MKRMLIGCAVSLMCGVVCTDLYAGSIAAAGGWKEDFAAVQRDCEELGKIVSELEGRGGGQYSRAAYEVVRYSLDAMENFDIPQGMTNRVARESGNLRKVAADALQEAKRIRAGEAEDLAVMRYAGGPVASKGPILCGKRKGPDGRIETDKPVMLTGWGHFGPAQRDQELLNRMGFNFLQMEVGLDGFFPKPDVVNTNALDWFFAAAKRADKSNTKIDYHLCSHYMAGWAMAKSLDSKVCRNHFMQFCVHDPQMVNVITNFQSQVASLVKDTPALGSFLITNEPGTQNNTKCTHFKRIWTDYLTKKYGMVEKMNELWRTNFTSFAAVDVPAPPSLPKSPYGLEFVRCNRTAFADFHETLAKAVRKAAPGIPLHAKVVADATLFDRSEFLLWGVDIARFAEIFDWLDNDGQHREIVGDFTPGPTQKHDWRGDVPQKQRYTTSMEYANEWVRSQMAYDFLRSFAAKPMVNSENHLISDDSDWIVPPEHVYSATWQDAIHGQRATANWSWERGDKRQMVFNGLVPDRPACLAALARCSLDLQRLSDELVPIQSEKPTVVLLWSLSSKVLSDDHDFSSAYAAASFLGEPLGMTNEEALERYLKTGKKNRALESARVVILPGVTHLPVAAFDALKKLEKSGVKIVVLGKAPRFDDFGRPLADVPWKSIGALNDRAAFDALVKKRGDWKPAGRPRLACPVFGVETHGYKVGVTNRIAICNHLRKAVEVELTVPGRDLITKQFVERKVKLEPMATLFVQAELPPKVREELEAACRDCTELGKIVERLEAKGQGRYSRMSYEVIRYSLEAMAKEDLPAGEINRVIRSAKEVSRILPRALAKAKRIEAGEEKDIAVPRFKSGPVTIKGPIFYGDREWPDGRIEHDKPVMLNGWGHFGGAQRDLELLNRMGHNYLQMEVGLDGFFPNPDVVNTKALNVFFATADRAQNADTKIDLHLCSHYMAGWAMAKSPDSRVCRNHFMGFCVHDPFMVGVITNFQRQAAMLTKDHPALASYCLTNEPGSQDVSKCSHMKAIWADYLAKKYGTVGKMNELWQTNFTDFAAVPIPVYPKLPKNLHGLDFVRCNRAAFADFHAQLAKAVRDVAPNVPIHSKTTVDVSLFGAHEFFFWSLDAAKIAEIFDVIDHDGVNCYCPQNEWMGDWTRSQMGYDFIRSFADKPMINTENHIIPDNCSGYPIPPEYVYSALWQDAIHGQRATAHWAWERGTPRGRCFNGLAPERPEILEMLGRCSLDLQRFSGEFVPIQTESPTVVMMWSLSSKILGKSHGGTYVPASFMGEPVGFVNEEALARYLKDGTKCRSLRDARVIILPGVTHLPDESLAALKKLEREGVAILAVGDSLAFDDVGRPRGKTLWPSRSKLDNHAVFDLLVAEFANWGFPSRPRLVKPVYGVETHGYEQDGVSRISVCNLSRVEREIELPGEGVDLISGEKVERRFKLKPLMPLFVEYRK